MLKNIFLIPLLLLTLPVSILFAVTDMERDEVTVAEPFCVSQWLSNDTAFEPEIFGEWELNGGDSLRIHPLPMASNSCLIELDRRMVPGFLFEVDGLRYVVVGKEVSENLEFIPHVLRYQLSDDSHSLEVTSIVVTTGLGIVENPEALFQMLKETGPRLGDGEQKLEFQRI